MYSIVSKFGKEVAKNVACDVAATGAGLGVYLGGKYTGKFFQDKFAKEKNNPQQTSSPEPGNKF